MCLLAGFPCAVKPPRQPSVPICIVTFTIVCLTAADVEDVMGTLLDDHPARPRKARVRCRWDRDRLVAQYSAQ